MIFSGFVIQLKKNRKKELHSCKNVCGQRGGLTASVTYGDYENMYRLTREKVNKKCPNSSKFTHSSTKNVFLILNIQIEPKMKKRKKRAWSHFVQLWHLLNLMN